MGSGLATSGVTMLNCREGMEARRGKGRSNAHRTAGCALFAAGLVFLLVAFAGSDGAERALAGGSTCNPATNIEAIVDDSGSMVASDPNRLRVQAMDLLIKALSPRA